MGKRRPLMLYNGVLYHSNFHKRARYCVKRAEYTCQRCGKKRGEEYIASTGRVDKVVIQAAHANHDPWNGRAVLMPLCKQCHLKYDALDHAKKARSTHYRKKTDRERAIGQLDLWNQRKRAKRVSA